MNVKYEYYRDNFKEIALLSQSSKCSTSIMQNTNTNALVVKKTVDISKMPVYMILKQIQDKHLAEISDVFEENGKCIIIEEYISGRSLYDLIMSEGVPEEEKAVEYIADLCITLKKIHAAGIVHRDIQPSNIIISVDGILKLIDFDISRKIKLTAEKDTEVLGTVGYAAPEQFGFMQTDNRTDIYSLGILFRYMLTGDENISYEGRYRDIISRCTYIDPEKRYATVDELLADISLLSKNRRQIETDRTDTLTEDVGSKETIANNKAVKLIKTIPGYRKGNPLYAVVATVLYALAIWYIVEASCRPEFKWYKNVLVSVLWGITFFSPYICIANIGNIIDKLKVYNKFDNRIIKFIIRVFCAAITFFLFGILSAIIESL